MVFMNDEKKSRMLYKSLEYVAVFAIFLLITVFAFYPLTTHMSSYVVNGGGDAFQSLWGLWWAPYSMFVMHASPYFTNMIYYPVGADLSTQTLMPLAGVFSAPFQLISMPFAYNIIFFLGFALSGLFAYMLAKYITGNKYAAFIAGMVFAFSPMHIAQSYGHLNWTTIEWIPLFFLFLLLMIDRKKALYGVGAGASFVLLTFMGDIEQGIIVVLATIIMLLLYLATKSSRPKILNKKFAIGFAAMVLSIIILGAAFFVPIVSSIINGGALSAASQLSDISHNMIWSDNVASFFIPSVFNSIFSGIARHAYGPEFFADPSEGIAYVGYVVIALSLIAIYYDYRNRRVKRAAFWLALAIIFAWLALGPYVQIGSAITQIPGLFMLYRNIPLFNIIREPGRFDIIATLALSVLSAIGFSELLKHEKVINKRNAAMFLCAALSIIIFIEYFGLPTLRVNGSNLYMNATIPNAYFELGNVTGNFTVLVLPDTLNVTSPPLYPGMDMYYQTAFRKPILGGYTSRTVYNQTLSVDILPLSLQSGYLEQGINGFGYPISENLSKLNAFMLVGIYNTRFVAIIRKAYNYTDFYILASYLYGMLGNPVYNSNTTLIFTTDGAAKTVGSIPLAYITGNWTPGYAFCGTQIACNSTFSNMWWGDSIRPMIVYVPPNDTNVLLNFTAASAQGMPTMYIYGSLNPIKPINITPTLARYSVPLKLDPGYNKLAFYMPQSSNDSLFSMFVQGYGYVSLSNFGVNNITIRAS